jgi:Zn-dependent alcohol dehydrogenase
MAPTPPSPPAVDINPGKFEAARKWGATDCINPKDHGKPIQQVIVDMTEWGCDYTVSKGHGLVGGQG